MSRTKDSGEGMVGKDVLQKLTSDFQLEVDRLRREIDEERKNKVQSESTKRTLDFQIVTLKDQLEQEERLKKKATLQKKTIQAEIDELKELATEADDLNDELEKFQADADALLTELKNDIQRERSARQAAEASLLKMERESQELKKTIKWCKSFSWRYFKKIKRRLWSTNFRFRWTSY